MASDAVVNLVVNADGAQSEVNVQLRTIVNDAERTAPAVNLQVNVDNSSVVTALSELSDRLADHLDEVNANLVQINNSLGDLDRNNGLPRLAGDADDADRSTSRLASSLLTMGRVGANAIVQVSRMTIIASIAASAIPVVGGLVAALAQIAPAATAGVAAFLTMQAVSATLKLGLTGVSDAISAVFDPDADPEKVAKALEKLSGEARDFVGVLQKMRPAFDDLRIDVQDRLFRGLDTTLQRAASATFPTARRAALDYAATLNEMARGAGGAATTLGRNGTLGQALTSSTDAFSKLERIPGQVLTAIVQLAAAGGPLLGRVTDRIADFADSASTALGRAFESGALQDAVDGAAETLQQLGRVAGNVFETIGNIFDVASDQGQGLFGTLEQITQAMADFTATEEFRDALSALLETGQVLVSAVLPVIEEALRALLPVIEVLAPPVQEIVTLLGEKLAELLPELAPVLLELATLFGTILEAVTPLIEEGLNVLIEIMPELIPLIQAVADLFTALSPLIEYFAVGAKELLVPALELAIEFFTYFVIGLREIIDWVNQTIIWIVEFADGAVKNVLVPAVQIAVALLRGDWAGAWDIAKEATRDASISIFNYTWNMGEDVAGALRSMFVQVTSMFLSGFVGLRDIAARGAVWVLDKIYGLRDQTLNVVFGLAGQLYNAGANMINSLARGILSQLGSAVSAAQEVVGAIRDFFPSSPAKRGPFSGRGYPLYSGREVVNSFVRGIEERRGFLNGAMSRLLDGAPLIASSGLMADPSAAGLGGTGFSPVTGLTFARTAPNVNVYIGNERLTGYIQNVVQEDTLQQDRLASQGVRGN